MHYLHCHHGRIKLSNTRSIKMQGSGLLLKMVKKEPEELKITHSSRGGQLLSHECANVVGGLTNNRQVISVPDVARLNLKSASGFHKVPLIRNAKEKNRNNIKFNI